MPPPDVPSPTPSNMPPPPTKRPRQTAAAASTGAGAGAGGGASTPGGASATGGGAPRVKRRKPEGSVGPDSTDGKDARKQAFGVGMVKGKEDEFAEDKDIQTRIDFNTLPLETLYRYLEMHDLLPRWDVSPWSEEPCIPPNALFANPPPAPAVPIPSSPQLPGLPNPPIPSSPGASSVVPVPSEVALAQPAPAPGAPAAESQNPATSTEDVPSAPEGVDGTAPLETPADDTATKPEPLSLEDEEAPAPPTTRSKTLPYRKPPTPTPEPTPAPEINRGVVTLSDVHAAREVLAEKANAHWVKGLGGGQNKEGETIVNFLYKMKAGPGRLLKLYVPTAASSPS